MKKILVAVAATLLLASCSGDTCKCTSKVYNGKGEKTLETTTTTPKPEDSSCSDVAKGLSKDLGELGKTVVTCTTVASE